MDSLERFRSAQERIYQDALAELRAGRKRSHWMWFIFPQIDGLGMSETAKRYAICDIEEARRYLADPVLGVRLRECVRAALRHPNLSPGELFGSPDDMKFRSCLTLFEIADPQAPLFKEALSTFYSGVRDAKTLALVGM